MAKERFTCDECDQSGVITYKQNDSRFPVVPTFCCFCGAGLEDQLEEDVEDEDEY